MIETLSRVERPTAVDLARTLEEPVTFDDVRAFVRYDAENYVRTLVHKEPKFEVRVFTWRPGQASSLHGHGDSACAFRVIRGAASETVLSERDRIWAPGSVVVEDRKRVHQVANAGRDILLTLHVYSPPLPIDAPSSPRGRQVVIVGGGFAAAAVAVHLLRRSDESLRLHLVEQGPWVGRGIAYGVESELFRLNVPASKMSIDPDAPDDFVRFAGAEAHPDAFLGRALFGRYVNERFLKAIESSPGKARLWRDEAVRVTRDAVELRSGRTLPAETVILATGLTPRMTHMQWHPGVIDAWDECSLATLPRKGRILLLGAGLSALDVLAFLEAQRFKGEVVIVSRRGLLPLPHEVVFKSTSAHSTEEIARAPKQLRELVRFVRETIESTSDVPWQRAVDRFRPHGAALYRALSHRDRARFVRHVRPYWDVVRHRAPADALDRVALLEESGRLRRVAGRIRIVAVRPERVDVEIIEQSGVSQTSAFDAVVRCIGPALDAAEAETPVIRSMLDAGLARMSPSGLGIETTEDGRIVDAHGAPSGRILGVGAVLRASHWETTAVPDIAAHARRIAAGLT
jgi:uncharacterized NAD(P)/FAD-binding protein YdhS/mannose-6-phosphate isomerase-like protein (cupin superfamily)